MTVKDLISYILKRKGQGQALNGDEGVLFGDPGAEIRGLLITWMATVQALREAARTGCNVVLCHESFYLVSPLQTGVAPQEMAWAPNRNRVSAAVAGGITVLRVHGSLDLICIWDDFVAALGIDNPTPGTGWNKVLPILETTVGALADRLKSTFGLPRVRVAGDMDQRVRVAGFPWGGLGLDTNLSYLARCLELGADVLIAGECDEYGFTFAVDAGVPMIETGHSLSENPGLRGFADRLHGDQPGLPVVFFPETRAFTYR